MNPETALQIGMWFLAGLAAVFGYVTVSRWISLTWVDRLMSGAACVAFVAAALVLRSEI